MAVSFAVDDVQPAAGVREEWPAARVLAEVLAAPPLASWLTREQLLPPLDTHPLVAAVHVAYAEHRPLVLTPDAVWLTIAQGLAHHVRLEAETLRPLLVAHEGCRELAVHRLPSDDWHEIVGALAAGLREENAELHDLVVADFSTTGPIERLASEVVLADVLAPYHDYVVRTVCGIPSVTLEGTPEDWSRIRDRVASLERYGLGFWIEHLLPICEQLVRSANHDVDVEFWRRIYKLRKAYGGEVINGWIAALFPYLKDGSGQPTRRATFPAPAADEAHDAGAMFPPGWLRANEFPGGLSRVPLRHDAADGTVERLELVGGLLGVSQDPDTLAVRPEAACAMRHAPDLDQALAKLPERHTLRPPAEQPFPRAVLTKLAGVPGELLSLYRRSDGLVLKAPGGRVLYSVRPFGDLRPLDPLRKKALPLPEVEPKPARGFWAWLFGPPSPPPLPPDDDGWVLRLWTRFCDLPDGSYLAMQHRGDEWWIVHLDDGAVRARRPVPRIARSFASFLRRAVDDGDAGPYFLLPGFTTEHVSLVDL